MPTRLTFHDVTATESGIHIARVELIDSESGIVMKVAKITPELAEFIGRIEVDIDHWYSIEKLKEKNPNIKKLISTFNLFT
jgi:hypothetical protein